jgi:nitrogen fixation protein NifU and related proteins
MKMTYEMYTKEVLKHFKHPKNMGKMENSDGTGRVGNKICGDLMELYIKVKDVKGKKIISDIKFQTFGCVAAISTSSMITSLAKGKTLEEALRITKSDITKSLGGLPTVKQHCSVLAADALAEAIYDYLSKNKLTISKELKQIHERIQRETKIVEEKHKDYIKMEKEYLRK